VGLDLTKYNMTKVGYGIDYPSSFGGEVKTEVVSFELISRWGSVNNLDVMGIFHNKYIATLGLEQGIGTTIELKEPTTDPVNASRDILQRYKAFAQNLGWNTSHIDQASAMLNNVSPDPSKNHSQMFNNIIRFVPTVISEGNMKLVVKEDRADWIYIEDGWDMPTKCLSIHFGSDRLSFSDTWNLYNVGSLSAITEEEAKSIGWEAAKNYGYPFTYENGTTFTMEPKWSNVSEINFYMTPGQKHKQTPDEDFVNPGSVTRAPLSLYPLWTMKFYFEMIGSASGVQVGVWGDTTEIAYISLFGGSPMFGPPRTPDPQSSTEPQPENTPINSPESSPENSATPSPSPDETGGNQNVTSEPLPETAQSENISRTGSSNSSANIVLAGGTVAVAAAAIAIALAVFKKRKK
jgi:hypothetical protein